MFKLREHKMKMKMCVTPGTLVGLCTERSSSHLGHRGLVQIQLQALDHFVKVPGLKTHDIFGYPGSVIPAAHGSRRG